jgi:hypothetical protein
MRERAVVGGEFLALFPVKRRKKFVTAETMSAADIQLMNKIKAAGPVQGVDFEDPQNAWTVWADLTTGVQFCGGHKAQQSANILAAQIVHLGPIYVVRTNPPAIAPFKQG